MGDKTRIEWATATWNPVTGCSPVGPECENCYARTMALRLQKMGQANYADGFAVRCHEHMLGIPLKWSRERRIFVCSMGDLFHDDVPMEFIDKVYGVMLSARHHTYYVLTKHPSRMAEYLQGAGHSDLKNIWHGVSCGCRATEGRIEVLARIPDINRFVSFEPLIETDPIWTPSLIGIGWVILGGESGANARRMNILLAKLIMDYARYCRVPIFFKQYGSVYARENGLRTHKGGAFEELSPAFKVREFPFEG